VKVYKLIDKYFIIMKILCVVDTHGSKKAMREVKRKAKECDIIVNCGDITVFSIEQEAILKEWDSLGKTALMLHGNHEDDFELKEQCDNTKNIKFMHRAVLRKDNVVFLGYGGGGFALKDLKFEKWIKTAEKKIKKEDKIVLMLHGPPYGTKLDELTKGTYCGNKSYMEWIKKKKPDLVVCGHIHENFERRQKIGKTLLINPGPFGMIVDI
jgi:Icc-related predicted phosphoesterase